MVAQISDNFKYLGTDFELLGLNGEGLFNPGEYGVRPTMMSTACSRGYVCDYEITNSEILMRNLLLRTEEVQAYPEIDGVKPIFKNIYKAGEYKNLKLYIKYSGGILLGTESIHDMNFYTGDQKPHDFHKVKEIIFVDGKIIKFKDHSQKMRKIRSKLEHLNDEKVDDLSNLYEITQLLRQCFIRDYGDWSLI